MKVIFLLLVLFVTQACSYNAGVSRRPVELSVSNRSGAKLEDAAVQFGENDCRWGWVASGGMATFMYYPHVITDDAEISWKVPDGRKRMKLDLRNTYDRRKAGRLIFTVTQDDVTVMFEPDK
jgi:hypothetical protein